MPYKLIGSKKENYHITDGDAFVNFSPSDEIIPILDDLFLGNYKIQILSIRKGVQNRKEELLKVVLGNRTSFFLYCFQTESGGRCNSIKHGESEARIQWRSNKSWNPFLEKYKPARDFSNKMLKGASLKNSRCYILGVYKRNFYDNDIIISGIYPTQAQEVEINSSTNKSIQFKYYDIQRAFINDLSYTLKKNDHLVVHFKPSLLGWYLVHQDEVHSKSQLQIDGYLEKQKNTHYTVNEVEINLQKSDFFNSDISYNKIQSDACKITQEFQFALRELIEENKLLGALEFVMKKRPDLEISIAKSIVQHEYLKMKHGTE
jgi:hypothetical protein